MVTRSTTPAVSRDVRAPLRGYAREVEGMLAQGHTAPFIAFVNGLATCEITQYLRRLDRPAPSLESFQPKPRRNSWSLHDYYALAQGWNRGDTAAAIGAEIGRSKSSVWAKRRWMGLPPRRTSSVARAAKADVHETIAQTLAVPVLSVTDMMALPRDERLGRCYKVAGSPTDLTLAYKTNRAEVLWTREAHYEIGLRIFAGQSFAGIASDMGVAPSTIRSMAYWAELPLVQKEDTSETFDHALGQQRLAEYDLVHRPCLGNPKHFIWTPRRRGPSYSRRHLKSAGGQAMNVASAFMNAPCSGISFAG